MNSIGVRELRQNASRYLARVKAGETIEVTERGTPVARLVPIQTNVWDDLVAQGRLRPASEDGDVADIEPWDDIPPGLSLFDELMRMRQDER